MKYIIAITKKDIELVSYQVWDLMKYSTYIQILGQIKSQVADQIISQMDNQVGMQIYVYNNKRRY